MHCHDEDAQDLPHAELRYATYSREHAERAR